MLRAGGERETASQGAPGADGWGLVLLPLSVSGRGLGGGVVGVSFNRFIYYCSVCGGWAAFLTWAVVGVSGDSVKNHQLFKKVHKLNFGLLADEDGAVAKKFGVPLSKGNTFKFKDADGTVTELVRGVTAARWTFVIDKKGKIAYKNTAVNAPEDSKTILGVVEKLK